MNVIIVHGGHFIMNLFIEIKTGSCYGNLTGICHISVDTAAAVSQHDRHPVVKTKNVTTRIQ